MYSRYVPNKLFIAHKSRLLFTYNDDSLRALNRQIVILDHLPLTTIKTLIMILIFQLEISRLMCICWHSFF